MCTTMMRKIYCWLIGTHVRQTSSHARRIALSSSTNTSTSLEGINAAVAWQRLERTALSLTVVIQRPKRLLKAARKTATMVVQGKNEDKAKQRKSKLAMNLSDHNTS
jgi:hypothetical protein